ncbi:unnamed protein product [Symbiodinium natans]|uniref:Uncharacterized protein n=1 Tax=Symbiodinium natans TaxID=878477 RepID=A0A812UBG6_9DINO|nr:unnamed protein product [Symbiodinium natans]
MRRPGYSKRQRSRSPKAEVNTRRISNALCRMIRYPEHRPEGLVVDSSGKVALSNLVSAWAEAEGLTKENILDTVQAHMWQDTEVRRYSILGEGACMAIRTLTHPV